MRPLHLPVFELDHVVGEPSDRPVVRGHHERDPRIDQRSHAVHHERPGFRVELRRRLVGDDDGGAGDDRLRERRSLLLATGQLVGQVVDPVTDPEPLEDVGVLGRPRPPRGEAEVLADREVRQEVVRRALEHEADHVSPKAAQATRRRPRRRSADPPRRRPTLRDRCRSAPAGARTSRSPRDPPRRSVHPAAKLRRHAAERVDGAGRRSIRLDEVDAARGHRLIRQRGAPPRGRSPRPSGGRAIRRRPTRPRGPRASTAPRRSVARTAEAAGSSGAGRGAAR